LPEFARRFTVLLPQGAEEAAVRAYLTPGIRQALMECRFQMLTAGGDAFALQPNPTGPQRVADENQLLRDLVDEALRLAPVLAGGRVKFSVSSAPKHQFSNPFVISSRRASRFFL
jgi:hypothetical protein